MGASINYSRWGLLWVLSMLAITSSGCGYSLRPMHWLVHNTIPSACKTCPGGLPGPNGCRSFANPWCAGYETTLWQHLGKDCGPARLPSALASINASDQAADGTDGSDQSQGDAPPELPDAFPSPLPEPGNLPPALPDLPTDETDAPPAEEFPFPVKPVPSSPPDEDPANPLREPPSSEAPTESPDLFPEFGSEKSPAMKEKPPAESAPKESPLVVPEKIDDLFNTPTKKPTDGLSEDEDTKLPDDFPSFENGPSPKQPDALPEPERKTPAAEPMETTEQTPTEVPKLFDENEKAPAKPTPELPEPNRIPQLPPLKGKAPSEPPPGLFPDSESAPAKEEVPKLFDDSSDPPESGLRLSSENHSQLRFGRVIQTSAEEEPVLRVQPAGGTVNLGGGIYGPQSALPGPPLPLLRIKQ